MRAERAKSGVASKKIVQGKATARRAKRIDLRRVTAFHEAGHVVLSTVIANKPERVSIRADDTTLGRSEARMSVRSTSRVQVHLAGFAAEHLLTGRRPPQFDREVGFALMARLDSELADAFGGFDHLDGHKAVHEVLRVATLETDDEIKAEMDRLYEIARASLSAAWPAVECVAKALLKHEQLDRDGIDKAIGNTDIFSSVFAAQRAHGLLPRERPVTRGG